MSQRTTRSSVKAANGNGSSSAASSEAEGSSTAVASPASPFKPKKTVRIDSDVEILNADGDSTPAKITLPISYWVKYEVPRKLLHSSIGLIALAMNWFNPPSVYPIVAFLGVNLVIVTLVDILRLNNDQFARFYESYLGFLMRDVEKKKINGVIWYLVGVCFVLSVYPRDVAVLSILILSWADTMASMLGRLFGKYSRPLPRRFLKVIPLAKNKSLAGFMAAFCTGVVVTIAFYAPSVARHGVGMPGSEHNWSILGWKRGLVSTAMITGTVAAVTEALDVGPLDDNVTLPIISGAFIWAWLHTTSSLV